MRRIRVDAESVKEYIERTKIPFRKWIEMPKGGLNTVETATLPLGRRVHLQILGYLRARGSTITG